MEEVNLRGRGYIYIYGADSKSRLIGKAPDDGKD